MLRQTLVAAIWLLGASQTLLAKDVCGRKGKGPAGRVAVENRMADKFRLSRMCSDGAVARMLHLGFLKPLPQAGLGFYVDSLGETKVGRITYSYPGPRNALYSLRSFALAWLTNTARSYASVWADNLKVTSASRSMPFVDWLMKHNANAVRNSAHLTGAVIDISYLPMSLAEKSWLQNGLASLAACGQLMWTFEKNQAVFHVFVFPTYGQKCTRTTRPVRRRTGLIFLNIHFFNSFDPVSNGWVSGEKFRQAAARRTVKIF